MTEIEPKIVYKVVYRYNKKLFSFIKQFDSTRHSIRYTIGHEVKPKIGKLFAFSTMRQAFNYWKAEYRSNLSVLVCEAWGVESFESKYIPYGTEGTNFKDFWGNVDLDFSWKFRNLSPWGTVICDRLKVLRKLTQSDDFLIDSL